MIKVPENAFDIENTEDLPMEIRGILGSHRTKTKQDKIIYLLELRDGLRIEEIIVAMYRVFEDATSVVSLKNLINIMVRKGIIRKDGAKYFLRRE